MEVPRYMVEQLETNLKLWEESDSLSKEIYPEMNGKFPRMEKGHDEELLRVLWFALCNHEEYLKGRINYRKKVLKEKNSPRQR